MNHLKKNNVSFDAGNSDQIQKEIADICETGRDSGSRM